MVFGATVVITALFHKSIRLAVSNRSKHFQWNLSMRVLLPVVAAFTIGLSLIEQQCFVHSTQQATISNVNYNGEKL